MSPVKRDPNFVEQIMSKHMTSEILNKPSEPFASAVESNKGFSSLKVVPPKLNSDCLEYLQNEAPSVSGEDSIDHGCPLDHSIKVTLADDDLWQKFSNENTEMVVTKDGRRLYPHFQVNIEGLDPNERYCLFIDISNLDHHRYKYQNHEWLVCGMANPPPPQTYYIHPYSPALGEKWMKHAVSFHKVKLTSSHAHVGHGKLLVHSMQRYQPRLHLVRANDVTTIDPSLISTFSFKHTTFVTVTAYQNIEITKLKVEHNPFARGFRANGGRVKNQSTAFWSPIDADVSSMRNCSTQTNELVLDCKNKDFLAYGHSRDYVPHSFSYHTHPAAFWRPQTAPICNQSSTNYSQSIQDHYLMASSEPYSSNVDTNSCFYSNSSEENDHQVVVKREMNIASYEYSFPSSHAPAPSHGGTHDEMNKSSCLSCGNATTSCGCSTNSHKLTISTGSKRVFSNQDLNTTRPENYLQRNQYHVNRSTEHRQNTVFPPAIEYHSNSSSCVGNSFSEYASELPYYYYHSQ